MENKEILKGKKDTDSIDSILKKTKKIIDPKIKEILNLDIDKKHKELVNYQIEIGGKRLRPALAILSCLACGGKIKDVISPAAGLEILHNYSLIIDDIIDNSILRRKKSTTKVKFGVSIAQCITLYYSASILQTANQSKNPKKISELLAKALKNITDGEILDILFEQSNRKNEPYILKNKYREITQKDYLKMIGKKTASLFQASCKLGGICAEAEKKKLKALKNYGFNLGIAFQISDDILDLCGEKKKLGKKIGQDIKERKLGNILILYALKELSEKEKLLRILKKKTIKEKDIIKAIKIIKKTRAKQKAIILEKKYIQKAKENLKIFPQSKEIKLLEKIADFVIVREY